MATLAPRTISFGTYTPGATPKYAGYDFTTALDSCAGGGDQFLNDGRCLLRVKNASGGIITVTVAAQKASDQGITTSCVFDVAATNGDRLIGPFDTAQFNDVNGYSQITYSGVTSLTCAVYKMAERGRG